MGPRSLPTCSAATRYSLRPQSTPSAKANGNRPHMRPRKSSSSTSILNLDKIVRARFWLQQIPDELARLTPRLLNGQTQIILRRENCRPHVLFGFVRLSLPRSSLTVRLVVYWGGCDSSLRCSSWRFFSSGVCGFGCWRSGVPAGFASGRS